jgi:hypothetical protein
LFFVDFASNAKSYSAPVSKLSKKFFKYNSASPLMTGSQSWSMAANTPPVLRSLCASLNVAVGSILQADQ